jgi:lysozyme
MTFKSNRTTHKTYKSTGKSRRSTSHRIVRKSNFYHNLFKRYPSWAFWIGGLGVVALYVWAFYFFFVGPTGFRWRALYGDVDYPEGYEIHGIDISRYQGEIDWESLQNAMIRKCPVRFIIIKATEGSNHLDENFNDNFYQAREYGFIRGAYHFWSNKTSARSQAYYFLKQVHLEDGDLPPVLDIEHKPQTIATEDFQRDILTWLHIVEDKYHVKPIIYTYYKFKEMYLNSSPFNDYPYWIAHYYVSKMEYKGDWKFWQHTDAGRLPGINGPVDFNIYNGSFYDLRKLTIGSHEQIGEDAYE